METKFKKLILLAFSVSLVITMFLAGACISEDTSPQIQEDPTRVIKDITVQEALTLIRNNRNNPEFIIIDVRTPEEFAEAHIEDAINIDFYGDTFRKKLDNLDKDVTYLIYCQSGRRSGIALDLMSELNFREVYNMLGGISHWETEGMPTVK